MSDPARGGIVTGNECVAGPCGVTLPPYHPGYPGLFPVITLQSWLVPDKGSSDIHGQDSWWTSAAFS